MWVIDRRWPRHAARMLRADLEAAGVHYVVDTGHGPEFADFHALRHSFVSHLAAAGVGAKGLQDLARHSDPRLTIGRYSHTSEARKAEAVNRTLPAASVSRDDLAAALILAGTLLGHILAPGVTMRVTEPNGES